jgi:hypothetical protein
MCQMIRANWWAMAVDVLAVLPSQSQDKKMLSSPITFQGFGDRFFTGFDALIAVLGQTKRLSLLSAVTQNQPLKVEIMGFKTSHSLEQKTAPKDQADAGPMGHVERPHSESASNDLQFTRKRLVPAADRP